MNRAHRRKNNIKKEPVYNVKLSDIMKIKKEAANEAVDIGFVMMMAMPIYVLRKDFGFGRVRLERFVDAVMDQYEYMQEGYLTIDDMKKYVYAETGIMLDYSNKNYNSWKEIIK